jgi:hypothetical protein
MSRGNFAPHVQRRPSQQIAKRFCLRMRLSREGNCNRPAASIAIMAKGDSNMGFSAKDMKSTEEQMIHGRAGHLLRRAAKATNGDLVAGQKAISKRRRIERLHKVFEKLGKQPSGIRPRVGSSR